QDPAAGDKFQCDAIKALVVPRTADLGDGFTVRRALPSAQSRMVGPFVFFDHFGPTVFKSGNGLDVRPHPHIGLATVTYLFDGEIDIAGDKFGADRLLVFKPGDTITIRALSDAHFTIFGGAPMDGPRHIWWNFVSSRKDRIEQAKAEWTAGHFQKVPGDEIEFIPLPAK